MMPGLLINLSILKKFCIKEKEKNGCHHRIENYFSNLSTGKKLNRIIDS